ncbi:MAG: hypothetical protein EU529_04000 [Promethearchaeota archaeon]|nr:MAG: hypothetical protein EU529_04000 [Candidatus Lokiarchaeota archaeon]
MQITKKKLKEEILKVLAEVADDLKKAPDMEGFMNNYKDAIKKNEELDEKIKQTQLISDQFLLRRFTI